MLGYNTTNYLKAFLKCNGIEGSIGSDYFFALVTEGIEWASATTTGWDRHCKAALVKFLNQQGFDAGKEGKQWFGMGWGKKSCTAFQEFLKAQGTYNGEITGTMGLGAIGSNWKGNDPTIKALQEFLNSQLG